MSYFGCTCGAIDRPHCHTSGNCPPGTPSTAGRRWCVYGGIGCNVDHDTLAQLALEAARDAASISAKQLMAGIDLSLDSALLHTMADVQAHQLRTAEYRR